jgi:hypothetical protein
MRNQEKRVGVTGYIVPEPRLVCHPERSRGVNAKRLSGVAAALRKGMAFAGVCRTLRGDFSALLGMTNKEVAEKECRSPGSPSMTSSQRTGVCSSMSECRGHRVSVPADGSRQSDGEAQVAPEPRGLP